MDNIETYSLLFADSFMEAILLPPYSGYVFKAMQGFGGFQPVLVLLLATLGVLVGTMANWLLGRMLITCRDKEWVIVETPRLDKAAAFIRKYLAWLVVFSWVPGIGGLLSVIAGFSKVRAWVMLMLAAIGTLGYYALVVFHFI